MPSELRSVALTEASSLATAAILPEPALIYSIPRTRVDVDLQLMVFQVEKITTTRLGDAVSQESEVSYEVTLDAAKKDVLAITLEDDPDLEFYLISESGFLADATEGAVDYLPGTTRLSS